MMDMSHTVKINVNELLQYTTKTNFTIVPILGWNINDNFEAFIVSQIYQEIG